MSTEEEVVIHIRLESDLAAGLAKDRAELEAFKKSLDDSSAASDAHAVASDADSEAVSGEADAHKEASAAIKDATKAKQTDSKSTTELTNGYSKLNSIVNKFSSDFQSNFKKNQKASKDFFDSLDEIGKGADTVLKGLTSTLLGANKGVAALAGVAGGAKLVLAGASVATKAWQGSLTVLAATIGAVTVGLAGMLAAQQEVQAIQLSPSFGGSSPQANKFLNQLYGDRNLAQFSKTDLLKTAQQLLRNGVPANQIQTAEESVGGISLTSGLDLKTTTTDLTKIAQLGKLTTKNIKPFLGILPQLDQALKQHLGEKGIDFVQQVTGNKIDALKNVNNVLTEENGTLIGKAKGWLRTIQSTIEAPGEAIDQRLKKPLDELGSSVNMFAAKYLPKLVQGFSAFIPGATRGAETGLDRLGKKFDQVMPTLVARFDKVRVEVDRFFDGIANGWERIHPSLVALASAWDAIWKGIKPVAAAIGDLVGGVLRDFSDSLAGSESKLQGFGNRFADFIKSLKPVVSDIEDIIEKLVTTDTSVLGLFKPVLAVAEPIIGFFRDVVDWLSRIGQLGNVVKGLVIGLLAIKGAIIALKAISTVTSIVEAFTTALQGMTLAELAAAAAGPATGVGAGLTTGQTAASGAGALLARLGLNGGVGAAAGTIGSALVDIAPPVAAAVGAKYLQRHTSSGGGFLSNTLHKLTVMPGSPGGFLGASGSSSNGTGGDIAAASNRSYQQLLAKQEAVTSKNQATAARLGLGQPVNPAQTLGNVNTVASTFKTSIDGAVAIVKYFGLAGDSSKQLSKDLSHISDAGASQALLAAGLGSQQLAKDLTSAGSAASTFHDALSNALEAPFNLAKAQVSLEQDIDSLLTSVSQHASISAQKSNLGNVVQDLIDSATQKFAGQKDPKKQQQEIASYVYKGLGLLEKDNPALAKTLGGTISDTMKTAVQTANLSASKIQLLADPNTLLGSINAILSGQSFTIPVKSGGVAGSGGQLGSGGTVRLNNGGGVIGDTSSSRFGRTLSAHAAFNSAIPGNRQITSGMRNFGLGSLGSDHLKGGALDIIGDNLVSYASAMNNAGGFAEFHGDGDQRHLHVVPPHGDSATPFMGGGTGSYSSNTNVTINAQPNHSPWAIAQMTIRQIDRRNREMAERS